MYSIDSLIKPKKIIKIAKRKNLDGVAITDHNTIKGGMKAKEFHSDDFVIIIGSEIKTEIGDVIGLFLNEEIISSGIWSIIDEIHDQDGLVILPHPFRADRKEFDIELIKKIDAIEGYNARTDKKKNIQAQEFAKEHMLPVTAGSDAHFYGEIGLAKTIIDDFSSEEDIKRLILNGDTHIEGVQSPLYFLGASRLITNVKGGDWYNLPHTLFKMSVTGVKRYSNRIRRGK